MNVQVISFNNKLKNRFNGYEFVYSSINAPQSFDEFDINIVSLQEAGLWEYDGYEIRSTVNCIDDLVCLQSIIQNSARTKVVLAFPQNCTFSYCRYQNDARYHKSQEVKNIIGNVGTIIENIIPRNRTLPWLLHYENTTTVINGKGYPAAFYFESPGRVLTKSTASEKSTTIEWSDQVILTCLDLSATTFSMVDFLREIGFEKVAAEIPQWLIDLECLDDAVQNQIVREGSQTITEAQSRIDRAKQQLDANLRYKSVLVANGDALVDVVFDMLEQLLDCKLTGFIDDKKEDFRVAKDTVTFIGEIKGVTSNVKSEHISQLDVHYHSYLDKLQEQNTTENVKQLLIINPFRTKPLSERDAVHEIQIALAKRNGSLIITTDTLLSIYELFLREEISSERVISVFSQATGLASIEMFK